MPPDLERVDDLIAVAQRIAAIAACRDNVTLSHRQDDPNLVAFDRLEQSLRRLAQTMVREIAESPLQ